MWVFSFPNPVNEYAARAVAAGVVVMAVVAIAFQQPWVLISLAYGFWARLLTGPTMSPLGQLASRVVAPRLPWEPKLVAGPPKRFAQAIGLSTATWVVVALLAAAATLESVFGVCLGCIAFGYLMKAGAIPEDVCEACADISLRHPQLSQSRPA